MLLVVKSINRSNCFTTARFLYRNIPDLIGDLCASVQILMELSLNSEWLLTVCSTLKVYWHPSTQDLLLLLALLNYWYRQYLMGPTPVFLSIFTHIEYLFYRITLHNLQHRYVARILLNHSSGPKCIMF